MNTITLDAIARGEAKSYTFEVKDAAGALMNLSGKKIAATLRLNDAVVVTKLSASIGGGSNDQIEVAGLGLAKVKIVPVDTASIEPCKLDGDLWVYTGAGDPVRVARFLLPVEQAQTRTFPA